MRNMKLKFIYLLLVAIYLSACSEYTKVLKNPDPLVRFSYAKKYFDQGKFSNAAALLEELTVMFRATAHGEEALYLLAQSYYGMKDYSIAAQYFSNYYKTYPQGQYTELARFYSAYSSYMISPDPRLDQKDTYKSMEQFQEFLEYYPQSERKEEAQSILFELQEKLAYKELMAVRLYYNLGNYVVGYQFPGGNYTSCVITAENAMRTYPFSSYKEEFLYYTIRAKYGMADQSIEEKKSMRYRDVIDDYYAYINDFPDGKFLKQVQRMYESAQKEMKDTDTDTDTNI